MRRASPRGPLARASAASSRPAGRPPAPAAHAQGRSLYRGARSSEAAHPGRHAEHARKAQPPTPGSGLAVARARVRETPWDTSSWIDLADLLYKRGEFDLAARAYRRVQELTAFGPLARRRKTGVNAVTGEVGGAPTPAVPVAPTPPAPPAPKVPILISDSGRTRAIRLRDSNILVALTLHQEPSAPEPTTPEPPTAPPPPTYVARPLPPSASAPSPASTAPTAGRSHHPPHAAHPHPGKGGTDPATAGPRPAADEKLRSGLQEELEKVLKMFDQGPAEGDGKEKRRPRARRSWDLP